MNDESKNLLFIYIRDYLYAENLVEGDVYAYWCQEKKFANLDQMIKSYKVVVNLEALKKKVEESTVEKSDKVFDI